MEVKVGEYITAQQIKNLQNAINREEKRRNVRIEQSGTYPNQSGISGGHTKRWVIDKLVTTGSMTSFTPVEKGDFVKSSDFAAMKNAIKALTGKTMDFNIGSSELDSIDTNTGSIIYAKDMNAMARIVSEMGKYCVCNNKEACNCKEACNSNCSCQGHCTCNSYDPCSCVGYTPPPPCTCRTYTCSCQSYTKPCTCKNDTGCGCKSYTSRRTEVIQSTFTSTYSYYPANGGPNAFNHHEMIVQTKYANPRNIRVESANVTFYIQYDRSSISPTQSYVNSITNEASYSDSRIFFDFRNMEFLGRRFAFAGGLTKSDWSIGVEGNRRVCRRNWPGLVGAGMPRRTETAMTQYNRFEINPSIAYFKSMRPYLLTHLVLTITVSYDV